MPTPPVWRVRDRTTFAALRRSGRRVRRGPVTVTWLPAAGGATDPPRLAFAIGTRTGGAVVRNRLRRRVRAAFAELVGNRAVAPGTYLDSPGAGAVDAPPSELRAALADAVRSAAGVGP